MGFCLDPSDSVGESMGVQWALSEATDIDVYVKKGYPSLHTLINRYQVAGF